MRVTGRTACTKPFLATRVATHTGGRALLTLTQMRQDPFWWNKPQLDLEQSPGRGRWSTRDSNYRHPTKSNTYVCTVQENHFPKWTWPERVSTKPGRSLSQPTCPIIKTLPKQRSNIEQVFSFLKTDKTSNEIPNPIEVAAIIAWRKTVCHDRNRCSLYSFLCWRQYNQLIDDVTKAKMRITEETPRETVCISIFSFQSFR